MRIAVAGGTGLAGRQTVKALRRSGHDAVVIARSVGVDLTTGDGLAEALVDVDALIDVTNTPTVDPEEPREFFATATKQLLAAEHNAGVRHHVVLSIVGVERVEGNGHYAGKRAQERAALAGPVPATIVRATQFFDFAAMVVEWTRRGEVATVPPLLVQPVAVSDVGDVLIEIAAGEPQHGVAELAGPELQDLVDMARRTLAARKMPLRLIQAGAVHSASRWPARSFSQGRMHRSRRPHSRRGSLPKRRRPTRAGPAEVGIRPYRTCGEPRRRRYP